MKRTILSSLIVTLVAAQMLPAAPKSKKVVPIERPAATAPSTSSFEFEGEDISFVVRTLASQAKMNVVIDNSITGTVTMRLMDMAPREAINVIAQSKNLLLDEHNGIFYLRSKNPPPIPAKTTEPGKSLGDEFAEALTPAFTNFFDTTLDYMARPETAQKIARAKKVLYEALITEGFTKDEAFRIILTHEIIPFDSKK